MLCSLFSPIKIRILLVASLFLALFLAVSLGATDTTDRETKSGDASYLLREGTRLKNTPGFFQSAGERTLFFMKNDHRRLICLENLALQRIKAQPVNAQWQVRGIVTEFDDENYFLIEMAVMTAVD